MKWLLLLAGLFLVSRVEAVTDPLGSQFQPSTDTVASDYPNYIYMTGPLAKVTQSTTTLGTYHWYGTNLMQNEIQSFQVHVHAPMTISSLTVTVSDLVNAQNGVRISSSTTDVVVWREWYVNVTTVSATSNVMMGTTGYMPEVLIPAIDPYFHQKTNAFPVAVSSGNNQSAWIDVHASTSIPSGYYEGTVTVSSGSVVLSTMPVVYGVWAWEMPSTATLKTMSYGVLFNGMCNNIYGSYDLCAPYAGAGSGGQANTLIAIDAAVQMLDNRVSMSQVDLNTFPESGSFASFDQYIGPLLDGTTAHVNSILPGASLTTFVLTALTPSPSVWQNWATHFTNKGWFSKLYDKFGDEPSGSDWTFLISTGIARRGWSTPVIPIALTTDYAAALAAGGLGEIDWIIPIINNLDIQGGSNHRGDYTNWLATSSGPVRQIGEYQDCESAGPCVDNFIGPSNATWPNLFTDGLPVANRAIEWMMFKSTTSRELYYASDICDQPGYCPDSPWNSNYAFGANGDGTLVYPASATLMGFSVGNSTPIWCPSMRLKMIRDAMQDYEYLNYLTVIGQGSLVQGQINSWITNSYTFNTDPTKLLAARQVMGNAIHQLTYPTGGTTVTTPPTAITGKVNCSGRVTIR